MCFENYYSISQKHHRVIGPPRLPSSGARNLPLPPLSIHPENIRPRQAARYEILRAKPLLVPAQTVTYPA
jgi:hypothetical protein